MGLILQTLALPLPLQSHLQQSPMTVMHALLVALAVVPMALVISAFNGDDVLINQLPAAEITTTASHTISHSVISMQELFLRLVIHHFFVCSFHFKSPTPAYGVLVFRIDSQVKG